MGTYSDERNARPFGFALERSARHPFLGMTGTDEWLFYPEYGRLSAAGVCPGMYAGLPCDVMVTVSEVRPVEVAVITVVPE